MVSRCSGRLETRTLNRQFPMVQSIIQPGVSPNGIWVMWWLGNWFFESQIPNGAKSHTVRSAP